MTRGITEHVVEDVSPNGVYVFLRPNVGAKGYGSIRAIPGKDVFASRSFAAAAANTMKLKKIASLRRQLICLQNLDFRN
jgi:hypothetical protein